MPSGLVVLDDALRVRWGNAAARSALPLPHDLGVGRSLWDAVPPLVGTPAELAVRRGLAEGRAYAVERVIGPTGCCHALLVVPVPGGLMLHLRDVTDVVAAESALRREERRYRQLVEHTTDVVLVLDREGRIRYASPAIERAIGESPTAVERRRWVELVHPEDVPALEAAFQRLLLGLDERPVAVRARVRGADGRWRIAEAVGQMMWPRVDVEDPPRSRGDPEPRADGVMQWRAIVDLRSPADRAAAAEARNAEWEPAGIVTVRDVTERAEAEEALRASEAHYRGLIEQLGDGLAVIDASSDGRLAVVNERLCEMTGYTREELLAMRVPEIVVDAAGDDLAIRRERLARGETLLTRRQLRRRDGTVLSTEMTTRLIGRRIQAVIRDVTEREEWEEHRRAVQRLEALGLLAGSVAHDFNNFLTAIQSNVELALSEVGEVPAAEGIRVELEDVRRVVQRAAGLTRQLLSFSRKQAPHPATFPLSDAVTGIEQMLRRLVHSPVELLVRGIDRSRWVRADLGQLEQVVMNLVVNARDAIHGRGTITVDVSARAVVAPLVAGMAGAVIPEGEYAVLTVADTGTGMSPETVRRLFEPLFTTKAAGMGTGLGLWTVHAVVSQAGGHVSVDTTPGLGTTFEVWLPALDPPDVAPADAPALAGGAAGSG